MFANETLLLPFRRWDIGPDIDDPQPAASAPGANDASENFINNGPPRIVDSPPPPPTRYFGQAEMMPPSSPQASFERDNSGEFGGSDSGGGPDDGQPPPGAERIYTKRPPLPQQQQQPNYNVNRLYGKNDLYYTTNPRRQDTFETGPPVYYNNKNVYEPPAPPPARRVYKIYPVLGKRSVREIANRTRTSADADGDVPVEYLSAHWHRQTRHQLYASIERYLEAAHEHSGAGDGIYQSGSDCVRRALCETAHKQRRDTAPGSFVGELLRVVFSLPDVAGTPEDHERLRRDDGYHEAFHGGDSTSMAACAQRYARCRGRSMWESMFTV